MPTPHNLCFTSAGELARLYRARKVSPLQVMQALLERIDRVNPKVNTIVTLDRDAALQQAQRATAPCGFTKAGLPVRLQIIGRRRQEGMVLRAAAAFETARPWADRIAPVVSETVLAQRIIPELESAGEPSLAHDSSTTALIQRYGKQRGRQS